MKISHSEVSLPISSTNYRKTLLDVVNFFETVFKPTPPPKLTSYRRLPSVTRAFSDVYSEKDTASDSEVTVKIKKIYICFQLLPFLAHRYSQAGEHLHKHSL
jgi:hypothetical protein